MGGLARKATIIDQAKLAGSSVLVFDSGDVFFLEDTKHNDETRRIHAEIIAKSYEMMGCNSIAPGHRDITEFGISYLRELEQLTASRFVSCNIYDSGTSERVFDQYQIEFINGLRVGYLGATSVFHHSETLIKEPIEDIRATVNKLSKEADFIILLFNGTDSDLDRLQDSDIDINLVLRSKSKGKNNGRASTDGGKDRIPVFTSGNRGKYLNRITVKLQDNKADIIDIALQTKGISQSKKHLRNKKKGDPNANLDDLYKDNLKILGDIAYHRKNISSSEDNIKNALNRLETFKVALNDKINSKPKVLLVVDDGMAKIPKGPEMPDQEGRAPGDPHHGHNH